MKDRFIFCEEIILALTYSGVAPFHINGTFKINKYLLYYNLGVVAAISLLQLLELKLFFLFLSNPKMTYFFAAFSCFHYGLTVSLVLILRYINLNGTFDIFNNIIKIRKSLICKLNGNFKPKKGSLAIFTFFILQISTIIFNVLDLIFYLSGLFPSVTILTFLFNYFLTCCDFFYILITLNLYNLFKALNKSVTFVFKEYQNPDDSEKSEKEVNETKLKICKSVKTMYRICDQLLNIISRVDLHFSKTNYLSLAFSAVAIVSTVIFGFTVDDLNSFSRTILILYHTVFFGFRLGLMLYFSRITMLEVNLKCHLVTNIKNRG